MIIYYEINIFIKVLLFFILYSLVASTLNTYIETFKLIVISIIDGILVLGIRCLDVGTFWNCFIIAVINFCSVIVVFNPTRFYKFVLLFFVSLAYIFLEWGFSYFLQLLYFGVASFTIASITIFYITEGVLIVVLSTALYVLFRYIHKRKLINEFLYEVEISVFGREMRLKMLLDSGNSLYDDLTGLPVLIISKQKIEQLLGRKINELEMRQVKYSTINGFCSSLGVCRPERIALKKSGRVKFVSAMIGVVDKNFKMYDGLLHMSIV